MPWEAVAFLVGLFALLAAEEAGVFLLPGDISIVAAGVYAAHGGPFVALSWMASSAGMVVGSLALFVTVRRSRHSTRVLPPRLRALIRDRGPAAVGAARLIPGLRNATVFAAAAAGLSTRTFVTGLAPAAVLWSGALLVAGYFGGTAILELLGRIDGSPLAKMAALALVVGMATFWLTRLRAISRPGVAE